jgi:hypothetical protein
VLFKNSSGKNIFVYIDTGDGAAIERVHVEDGKTSTTKDYPGAVTISLSNSDIASSFAKFIVYGGAKIISINENGDIHSDVPIYEQDDTSSSTLTSISRSIALNASEMVALIGLVIVSIIVFIIAGMAAGVVLLATIVFVTVFWFGEEFHKYMNSDIDHVEHVEHVDST